jgi:hypothetical protein
MVGYFYHMNYLHNNDAVVAPAVIEVPDSPPRPKKKAKRSAPAKRGRASTSAPAQAALPPSPKVHLIEHAKVFAMAVKYHVGALQILAVQKFKFEVEQHWDHEDLAHAIHVIYTSTADEVTQLREVAVEALDAHRGELLEKPEIAALLRSITGLACDLLMRGRASSTRQRSLRKAEVQDDVVCYYKLNHRVNQHVYEVRCTYCDEYFEVCSQCNGDPAWLSSMRPMWKCINCGRMFEET